MQLKAVFLAIPGQNMKQIEEGHKNIFKEIEDSGGPGIIQAEPHEITFPEPSLVLVQSGGTEKEILKKLQDLPPPYYLLAGEKFNALPAAMEVLTSLRKKGKDAEIIHGSPEFVAGRLKDIFQAGRTLGKISGLRLGVIGKPSDWLVASSMDWGRVLRDWGVELVKIEMEELDQLIEKIEEPETFLDLRGFPKEISQGALKIYGALAEIFKGHNLQGFTLRCFDLLGLRENTGCLGLSLLNDRGFVGVCEGDVPSLLSMAIIKILTGKPSFMANPAKIDVEKNEVILAHCTVPLKLTSDYSFHSHFESGLGVAIRGKISPGPCTVFKLGSDGREFFVSGGEILESLEREDLCRTQLRIRLAKPVSYFLSNPLGNHHIVVPGDYESQIIEVFRLKDFW